MASLNKFRSKNVLNKSHNKLHGLTLCATMVFNMSFEWLPHLCTQHTQLSVRSLRQAGNFKPRFSHKDQGDFPMPRKEGPLTLSIMLSMVKLLLHFGWCIRRLTQLSERKEPTQGFHHEANVDFKTSTVEVGSLHTLRLESLKLVLQPFHKFLVNKL